MLPPWPRRLRVATVFVLALGSSFGHAGIIRDTLLGLRYFAFDVEGRRNPLTGGVDFSVSRNLLGNPLDFGPLDLTLRGPVSFDLSTGGLLFPEIEAALTVNLRGPGDLPGYALIADLGGQATALTGTVQLDTSVSLNSLGFYDATFAFSSDRTVTRTGILANDEQSSDFELPSIDLAGNIFADALALITDPFFKSNGQLNIFAELSGPDSLSDLLLSPTLPNDNGSTGGDDGLTDDPAALPLALRLDGKIGISSLRPGSLDALVGQSANQTSGLVPEPTVLLLMLLGLPAVLRRRAKR